MKMLIDESELDSYGDKIPCECLNCGNIFYISKSLARRGIKGTKIIETCSRKCVHELFKKRGSIKVKCRNCGVAFLKNRSQVKKFPNSFCSNSCSAKYNNAHKKYGTRRSKLEAWLEIELQKLYPNLEIHHNRKDAINSELDIYIPSLKLAFELNGIFHYEPIYGKQKLSQIQNNDERKFQACIENGIELCIIDSSGLKYFKPSRGKKYLEIISKIINTKQMPE